MSLDSNCESLLNFELPRQRSKCAKSPIYQFPRISYFGLACPKLNVVFISRLTGKCAKQNLKNYAILVYGHVHILWSY